MKRVLTLMACLMLTTAVWADDPAPPPPLPVGDNSEPAPPPMDLKDLTPLPVPPSAAPENPNPVTEAVPTDTPVPAKVEVPTDTFTPEIVAPQPTATPEPAAPAPEEKPAEKEAPAASTNPSSVQDQNSQTASSTNGSPQAGTPTTGSGQALTDYFPASEGAQWNYAYLKPSAGETAKKTFTVKCASAKAMANGTVRAVFETSGGLQSHDRYSLFMNMVEHTASGDQALAGDFAFKVPAKDSTASWSLTEKDGTIHKFKAAFGQAQVYQKTYPDCLVVTEKVVKDGKTMNTLIDYYAKGTGLVALEVYTPSMKLIQDKSFALVKGPGVN